MAIELLLRLSDRIQDEWKERDHRLWELYASLLPKRTGCAALWDDHVIEEMQFLPAIESAFQLKERFLQDADGIEVEHGLPYRAVLWALSMVHSRSFALSTQDGTRLRVLAPLADLFNHVAEDPASAGAMDLLLEGSETGEAWKLGMDEEGKPVFQMSALHPCDKGEEVLISYGHETNAELLISYGFLLEPNPAEYVPVYGNMEELLDDDRFCETGSVSRSQISRATLLSCRSVEAPLAIRPGGIKSSRHLISCLYALHASERELGFLREKFDGDVGELVFQWEEGSVGCPSESRRADIERMAIRQAAVLALELLSEFPTTLEEDDEIMEQLLQDQRKETSERYGIVDKNWLASDLALEEDNLVEDMTMAVRYRMGVKKILTEFLEDALSMGFTEEELLI